MSEVYNLQLKSSAILSVPIQAYDNDFSFIVNGEEYKTSRLVSDLLSTKISKIHANDPTMNFYIIDTEHKGDFSQIIKLVNFEGQKISACNLQFTLEVLEKLGNENIELDYPIQGKEEITLDNVFSKFEHHQQFETIYRQNITKELDFISTHFSDVLKSKEDEIYKIDINNFIRIISNDNLQLRDEDELLKLLNKLYSKDSKYSVLYEFVFFENVESATMKEFIDIIDFEDVNERIWSRLCMRLQERIERNENEESSQNKRRYKAPPIKGKLFQYDSNHEFSGVFKYLRSKSNGQIQNEINVTASSHYDTSEYDAPINVTNFEEKAKSFVSDNKPDSWILFDFKKNRIIPTRYTIRTRTKYDCCHPATWVIEGSADNDAWDVIDKQDDSPYLKGIGLIHTYEIKSCQSAKEYQYIRLRQTGKSANKNRTDNDHLIINSIEFYGTLIESNF